MTTPKDDLQKQYEQQLQSAIDMVHQIAEKTGVETNEAIWSTGINALLKDKPAQTWRCLDCGQILDKLDSAKKIIAYMTGFENRHFKSCKKCRTKNYFILQGDLLKFNDFIFDKLDNK